MRKVTRNKYVVKRIQSGQVQLNVWINSELYERVKKHAENHNVTIEKTIDLILRKYIQESKDPWIK